ncbi:MAG TPA: PAS domain S-box protein [Chthoniobacteraceae bacterium]|jgi:PAS domain S-box-containing protein|nr:PAS domain S-box protein [Chthoniobacteraceae bacterium]
MEEGDAHPNERTSLRETEEALRASEEHLRLALDASHAGTWSWEVISNITTWDNRYHALYGLGPNDPRSYEVWMTRVHPADRPRLESRLKELLEPGAGEIWNEEFRAILPSGGERWMVELGSIERDKDGRAVRFRGINLDITERKRVEQELKVTVSRLRSILDSTADGLLIVDATGRITDFNRQFAGMWQLPEGILAARNDAAALGFVLDQLVAPENFLAKVRELYAHPEQSSSDVLYFKDGRTLERYSQPHWLDGRVIGRVWSFRDVTARRHAEKTLAELNATLEQQVAARTASLLDRERRERAILNTVTDAIITLDALGVITGVNPATLQIFGYALDEELVGRNIKVLVPPPRSEAPADFIPRYLASGMIPIDGVRREGLGQQKDGSVFPIDVTVGEIEHTQTFTAVIRDISGRKTLEAEVLRISAEERQRMAADLHDGICQDLVAISLAANVLQKEMQEAADPHAERVGGIEAATLQVAAEARHLARGMSPVVPEGTGLMAALRQLAATTAATHRIKCPFFCRETVQVEDPVVANQLYRIAQEAIHNAVRHGSAKRIALHFGTDRRGIVLAVKDDGGGLPSEHAEGPGVGLRVMKYRAALIRAGITIRPRPQGRGTEVICRLARARN